MKLKQKAHDEILDWARRFPEVEVTGIVTNIGTVLPMENVSKQPERHYEWSVLEMRLTFRAMDDSGEEPVAFYHSHPSGKPDPSEADMLGALNPGIVYLIAYPNDDGWHLSAWLCLEPGILIGEALDVIP